MAQDSPLVALERHPNFAVIRWNRPTRKNAIIPEVRKRSIKCFKSTKFYPAALKPILVLLRRLYLF